MTKIGTLILTILVLAGFTFAQDAFQYVSEFPAGTEYDSYGQGLAVDGEGKVWYTPYYSSDSVEVDTSGDGNPDEWQSCRAIYVFEPDGTPASFSPIKIITVDGTPDTLWNSNRGPPQFIGTSRAWRCALCLASTSSGWQAAFICTPK